eukprot:SAG11_NODE_1135_length_5733_cov_3.560603_2_plen_204_part_00
MIDPHTDGAALVLLCLPAALFLSPPTPSHLGTARWQASSFSILRCTDLATMLPQIRRIGELSLTHVTEAPHADALLRALAISSIPCAVATNDEEQAARAQLLARGWLGGAARSDARTPLELFGAVIGCDSGFGGKPDPQMLLAAAAQLGVAPERCAMVGDAAGDLLAAKRAGFGAAILVGPEDTVGRHAVGADLWVKDLSELM